MNPDKLLTLLMGRCWHEWIQVKNRKSGNLPFEHLCLCGHSALSNRETLHVVCSPNPSYSDPRHRDEFFTWLTRERGEMWEMFLSWALRQYEHPWAWEGKTIAWLFFSSPSRPRDLMAEWLQLDETVERWGWTPCDGFPECMQGERDVCKYPDMRCEGNGKTRGQYAPWARLVQDAKEEKDGQ